MLLRLLFVVAFAVSLSFTSHHSFFLSLLEGVDGVSKMMDGGSNGGSSGNIPHGGVMLLAFAFGQLLRWRFGCYWFLFAFIFALLLRL